MKDKIKTCSLYISTVEAPWKWRAQWEIVFLMQKELSPLIVLVVTSWQQNTSRRLLILFTATLTVGTSDHSSSSTVMIVLTGNLSKWTEMSLSLCTKKDVRRAFQFLYGRKKAGAVYFSSFLSFLTGEIKSCPLCILALNINSFKSLNQKAKRV